MLTFGFSVDHTVLCCHYAELYVFCYRDSIALFSVVVTVVLCLQYSIAAGTGALQRQSDCMLIWSLDPLAISK